jgi:thiamine kinase-like enzyme
MEETVIHIKRKAEELFGTEVDCIEKYENVPNNSVYKIFVSGKPFIFKIYKQKTWPEDGKTVFVNNKLIENNISCARVIAFDRTDPYFQNGFLIEEFLSGKNAGNIVFDKEYGKAFYKKLALLVSRVHSIRIENYGYIGSGIACSESFVSFIDSEYDEMTVSLTEKKLFDEKYLLEIKKPFILRLKTYDSLPSVLCHGDLSTKNVMINEKGELTLIDWDDAMSYNWMADIARMTYWMKYEYGQYEYELFRSAFLEYYSAGSEKNNYDDFERVFHLWIGLDFLNYYAGIHNYQQYERTLGYLKETVNNLI